MEDSYRDSQEVPKSAIGLQGATRAASGPVRQDKHIVLAEAVRGLDDVISQAEYLIDRIQGCDQPRPANPETKTPPPLIEVLEGAPGAIRGKTEEISSLLERINELLF